MAKCVKQTETGIIIRVDDEYAALLVRQGRGVYVPKKEWKKATRPNYTPNEKV